MSNCPKAQKLAGNFVIIWKIKYSWYLFIEDSWVNITNQGADPSYENPTSYPFAFPARLMRHKSDEKAAILEKWKYRQPTINHQPLTINHIKHCLRHNGYSTKPQPTINHIKHQINIWHTFEFLKPVTGLLLFILYKHVAIFTVDHFLVYILNSTVTK